MSMHVPTRAELGRSEWLLLHAQADQVSDAAALGDLVKQVGIVRDRFPCATCRVNVRKYCHSLVFETQWSLRKRVKSGDYRSVAVAWMARLHACVTLHLVRGVDASAKWTTDSEQLALAIEGCGDDDAAVVRQVDDREIV